MLKIARFGGEAEWHDEAGKKPRTANASLGMAGPNIAPCLANHKTRFQVLIILPTPPVFCLFSAASSLN
ncbi:MAG: hypothetical protein DYG96_02225 [Chlorobi bacterium CHB2]|nr:hypothetical protein [Chlorobi bacterium CHB2]